MTGEFKRRIKLLGLDEQVEGKVIALFEEAGEQFPCLKCPSKDECENLKWFSS